MQKRLLPGAWFAASAASTLVVILFPMAAPVVLIASTVVLLGWRAATGWRLPLPLPRPSAVIVALVLIDVYLLINSSWSLSSADAIRSVGLLIVITAILYLTFNALDGADPDVLRSIATGLVVGIALAGLALCIEAFSARAMQRFVMGYVPPLRPSAHHTTVRPDGSIGINAYLMNRSIGLFTVLFWPAVLLVGQFAGSFRQRTWLLIALAPGVAAMFRSAHGTSKIAFVGAAIVFGVYLLSPRLVTWLARAGWVAAALLVIPAAVLAFGAQLYLASWLPKSAQHRVVIWGVTAERIAQAPLLGVGIASARASSDWDKPDAPRAPGSNFTLSIASHAHNAYLQVWFETGALGALLLSALGLLVLRAIAASPDATQVYLYPTFAACALLAASSFSIWAPWLLATFGIVTVCTAIGVTLRASAPVS